ncbi:MAG: hypothetical protein ACRDRS_21640 [Pseudonocardiaceae bacterium]
MSEQSWFADATPPGTQDVSSILLEGAQRFQLEPDQAPPAIANFRQAAQRMRDLMVEAVRLTNVPAPGLDAVSLNAALEIGRWAGNDEPGSLRWALDSGAIQLEQSAEALEQSLASYQSTDEANAAQLRGSEL